MKRKAVLTVETLPDERFAVKVNGTLVTECKDYADVEDFIDEWEPQAKNFRYGYAINRDPVPFTRKRKLPRRTAAGKLLQDDALAAETYLIASIQSLWADHGWTEEQIRHLFEYVVTSDYDSLTTRKNLPPIKEATYNPFNLRRFFE